MEGFTTERPTESGYYYVIWEPGDSPVKVYIRVCNDPYEGNETYYTWGWTECDDPESIEMDIVYPHLIQFKPAFSSLE